jgi:hypothetical protein
MIFMIVKQWSFEKAMVMTMMTTGTSENDDGDADAVADDADDDGGKLTALSWLLARARQATLPKPALDAEML